jgi:hypothetical protein
MPKRLWPVLLGPPLILVAALAVGHVEPGARAARLLPLHPIAACTDAGVVAVAPHGRPGAWWKTSERLDSGGRLLGRRLFVGVDRAVKGNLDLPVESAVSGPVGGIVVVTADDGVRSSIRLVAAATGCGVDIYSTNSVVRNGILNTRDGSVLAHLVDRDTRADLGTWRIAPTTGAATEARIVAPPLGPLAAEVGTVWGTDLRLDATGTTLAVQSCTDLGCLTRLFDLGQPNAPPLVVRGLDQGPLLGFAGKELVTWAACPGFPCSVHAWNPSIGKSRLLVDGARAAGLTRDGRRLVAFVQDAQGGHGVEVDPVSGRSSLLRGLAAGQRPLGSGPNASIGLEVAADEIVLGSGDTDPQAFRPDAAAEEALP